LIRCVKLFLFKCACQKTHSNRKYYRELE